VAIFVGSHEQKVDSKGRVSVPARFREVLGKDATFYAFPSFSHGGVECLTSTCMEALSDQIDDLDTLSDEQDHLSAAIFGMSHPLTPDKEGRVILPDALCEHAGITDTVVFVGLGKSFQLWEPAQHESNRKQVRGRALADRQALRRRPQANPGSVRPVESGT
jgi:MraZ protein